MVLMLTTIISFAIMYTVYMSAVLTHIIFDMDASLNKRISSSSLPMAVPYAPTSSNCAFSLYNSCEDSFIGIAEKLDGNFFNFA